jgi:hypothetical protein
MSHVFEQVNSCQTRWYFRNQNVHETLSEPSSKILFSFEVGNGDARREWHMIHCYEQGNAQRIKMEVSESVVVFFITKCIMTPDFTSVCHQGNFKWVIPATYDKNTY